MLRKRFSRALAVTTIASLVIAAATFASDVDVSVVDVTAPTESVTLAPGGTGNITINMSVTGNQVGTATFEVYRDWTLTGGTFSGANPQEFTVGPRAGGDPATTFSTTGIVTVAAGHAAGTFTLAVGAFDITNTNATGAKLAAGASGNYVVTVDLPSPPTDTTAPVIGYTLNPASPDGSNGWYTSDVTLTWTVTESESPSSLVTTGCVDQTIASDLAETTYSCSASSDGGSAGPVNVAIKRDGTAPSITGSRNPVANVNGWNNSTVVVTFTCDDATSGVATCGPDATLSGEGAGQSATGTATDNAGNSASDTVSGINIDLTSPSVALVGGPADGGSYYYGFVPAAPTCSASDALSGLDGTCSVAGYGTTTGTHTVTASASDRAGNTGDTSATYTVLNWNVSGFYRPVEMTGTTGLVVNTVKGGQTVPLKFEVFAGPTGENELTDTSAVKSFQTMQVACNNFAESLEDPVEIASTGGTSLRYDSLEGQFIQNWKTPNTKNSCYVAVVTFQDGSNITAYFKSK